MAKFKLCTTGRDVHYSPSRQAGRQVYAVKNQSMNSRISDHESIEYHLTLILWYFDIFIILDLIQFTSLMKVRVLFKLKIQ